MNTPTRALLAALPLVAALALAGCAGATDDGDMPGMDHGSGGHTAEASSMAATQADVMFVTMMIPHHEQAMEMADLLLAKDGVDPRVVAIAERIQAAQGPEIEVMQGWLEEWGIDPGTAEGMEHGDGMMSADDMAALEAADGAAAGRLFLEQMVVHHEGAVEMAQATLDDAADPDVRTLAQQVIDDQSAEIAEMQELAAQL